MWTDFTNSFTNGLVGKFSTPQRLPPQLQYNATHYLVKFEKCY